MLSGREHTQDEFFRGRSGFGGPVGQSLRRPVAGLAVRLGHVVRDRGVASLLVSAPVTGNPVATVEALEGGFRDAHIQLFFNERMGYRVIVAVHRHVVVDVHAGLFPLGVHVRLLGRGCRAGLSSASKCSRREPGSFLKGRALSFSSSSRMAALSSAREKKVRCRSAARIQRSTTSTPASTLALSRGRRTRVGNTATP